MRARRALSAVADVYPAPHASACRALSLCPAHINTCPLSVSVDCLLPTNWHRLIINSTRQAFSVAINQHRPSHSFNYTVLRKQDKSVQTSNKQKLIVTSGTRPSKNTEHILEVCIYIFNKFGFTNRCASVRKLTVNYYVCAYDFSVFSNPCIFNSYEIFKFWSESTSIQFGYWKHSKNYSLD